MSNTKAAEYAAMVTRPISARQQEFTNWLIANTGYDVDARSVALGANLRNVYLKTDEYRAAADARDKAKAAAEIAAVRKAEAAAEKRAAALKAKRAKFEKLLEVDEEQVEEVDEEQDVDEVEVDEVEVEEPEVDEVVEKIKAKRTVRNSSPAPAAATKPAPRRRTAPKA